MIKFPHQIIGHIIRYRTRKSGPIHRGLVVSINEWGFAQVVQLSKNGHPIRQYSWVDPELAELKLDQPEGTHK